MSHPERAESKKVTIEDIIRLKRSERPAPEFWSRFEHELRVKQLAAIVEKRPWWIALRLPQAARYLAGLQVPLGAAAVLALSVVAVREYRPAGFTFSEAPASTVAQSTAGVPPSPVRAVAVMDLFPVVDAKPASSAMAETRERPSLAEKATGENTHGLPAAAGTVSVGPGELMAMIPWAPQRGAAANEREAVTLGELSQDHFASVLNPGRDHDFHGRVEVEPVVMPVHAAVAAVADMVPPSLPVASSRELRRNRILSNLMVADNTAESERSRLMQVREVVASTLDDDRLYDSVRRLGMGGDRLTLKF